MPGERMYPILPCPDIDEAIAFYAALGFQRMVRPRRRWGTVYGFSVVDVGGNWLRFSKLGDS